jgi:hypothetical protein
VDASTQDIVASAISSVDRRWARCSSRLIVANGCSVGMLDPGGFSTSRSNDSAWDNDY